MRPNTKAFPLATTASGIISEGMTLRDYFAIRIAVAVHTENVAMNDEQLKTLAKYAYKAADAFMMARED